MTETNYDTQTFSPPDRRPSIGSTDELHTHPAGERASAAPISEHASASSKLDRYSDLTSFESAILAVRWATTLASLGLAAGLFHELDLRSIPWVILIVALSVVRTVVPLRHIEDQRTYGLLLGELGLQLLAVIATGHWSSPLVFSLTATVTISSFARGFGFGLQIAAASSIAITVSGYSQDWSSADTEFALQWSIFLLLVAAVSGYVRQLSRDANEQYSATLEQVSDLTEANALLFNLHRIAQTLPASLDLDETLESTNTRLRSLIDYEAAVILLFDETDSTWAVASRQGIRTADHLAPHELPPTLRQVSLVRQASIVTDLKQMGGGLGQESSSGLYAPLMARGSLIGLLAVEHRDTNAFDQRDLDVLTAMAEPVALAIDNARWFKRLRTVGANEERTRIARDLHDRIGQSLAYLAFEVDRIVRTNEQGGSVTSGLSSLRTDVRTVIGEVRDTLYDLRSDVATGKELASVLEEFSERVAERSGVKISLDCDRGARLPIVQEREMWRIAQEALINVERHADASHVTVAWTCDGKSAVLNISDNGRGFPDGQTGRVDSYGILGMRERAASIGASLEIISHPGEGTTVWCCLEQD